MYFIWSVLIKGVHDSHDRDRMVVGFTTTCAISAYHHWCEFESRSGRCVHYVIKVCQWLVTGRWFYPGPSTNKTVRQNIIEILLKVALPCDHGSCKPMYETNKNVIASVLLFISSSVGFFAKNSHQTLHLFVKGQILCSGKWN